MVEFVTVILGPRPMFEPTFSYTIITLQFILLDIVFPFNKNSFNLKNK